MTSSINDPRLRQILDAKGRPDGKPAATNANALPLRRVISLAKAMGRKPLSESRVLDLACQDGSYGLEAALAGARMVGIEARERHVERARTCAEILGLRERTNIEVGDVRRVSIETHGRFDIVLMLGILYHLDAQDAAETLERIAALTDDLLIIDTHIALNPKAAFAFRGRSYEGAYIREHDDSDDAEARRARGQASIDNTFAFYFTRQALARLLVELGFTFVCEALAPLDATKPADRLTLVACRREMHQVKLYPWINGLAEDVIAETSRPFLPALPGGLRTKVAHAMNAVLHPLGFTLSRR
jgi:hypothetical protein